MQAFAHYAAMPDLNVWPGRTSNYFRTALTGIAFGGGFVEYGGVCGRGGSTLTSRRRSEAQTASICNSGPSGKPDLMARSLNTAHG